MNRVPIDVGAIVLAVVIDMSVMIAEVEVVDAIVKFIIVTIAADARGALTITVVGMDHLGAITNTQRVVEAIIVDLPLIRIRIGNTQICSNSNQWVFKTWVVMGE